MKPSGKPLLALIGLASDVSITTCSLTAAIATNHHIGEMLESKAAFITADVQALSTTTGMLIGLSVVGLCLIMLGGMMLWLSSRKQSVKR